MTYRETLYLRRWLPQVFFYKQLRVGTFEEYSKMFECDFPSKTIFVFIFIRLHESQYLLFLIPITFMKVTLQSTLGEHTFSSDESWTWKSCQNQCFLSMLTKSEINID